MPGVKRRRSYKPRRFRSVKRRARSTIGRRVRARSRVVRRFRRRGAAKRTRVSTIRSLGIFTPDRLRVRLPYSNEYVLSWANGGSAGFLFRGQNPRDVVQSGTADTRSAALWGQYSNLYSNVICRASAIRVHFVPIASTTSTEGALATSLLPRIVHCTIVPTAGLFSISDAEKFYTESNTNARYVRRRMALATGASPSMKYVKHYMSTKKYFGIRPSDVRMEPFPSHAYPTNDFTTGQPVAFGQPDFSLRASIARETGRPISHYYPVNEWNWGVYFTTPNLRSSGVYCRVSITYYCEFFNAKNKPDGYRGELPDRPIG